VPLELSHCPLQSSSLVEVGEPLHHVLEHARVCAKVPTAVLSLMRTIRIWVPFQLLFHPSPLSVIVVAPRFASQFRLFAGDAVMSLHDAPLLNWSLHHPAHPFPLPAVHVMLNLRSLEPKGCESASPVGPDWQLLVLAFKVVPALQAPDELHARTYLAYAVPHDNQVSTLLKEAAFVVHVLPFVLNS
jgi:hypothetical protein